MDKYEEVIKLYSKVSYWNPLVRAFFDVTSEENLDLKIEVLRKLDKDVPPSDIPEFYDILEKYPKSKNVSWDA